MSKRRMIDPTVAALMEEDAGKGVSTKLSDSNRLLVTDDGNADWYDAFDFYVHGDKNPLLTLLRSDRELTPDLQHHLANALEGRGRNGKRLSSYEVSEEIATIHAAIQAVMGHTSRRNPKRLRRKEAIEKVAKGYRLDADTLASALDGKHGAYRRLKKRLPAY